MKEKKLREILKHNKLNRLKTFAEETTMCLDLKLSHLREELQITQQEIANKLQISQPSVVALEKRGTDIKLSSIQRYIDAIGGQLQIAVALPSGKSVIYKL
ncbi:helix-turn-helix domain-containing protein [Actinobacillus pleuropneumoniae]|uniref:Transcriptional regulator n=6 Tax=Actinobacillus TaxID=713 RepID=A0A223MCL0_ACTPL|nr:MULTISPECIES: XRE family transcriptional regulator [Actinobacillus]ABN74579.1 putative transcriptional regulator [Actinobacillus pleuropneumoniae serovar 5b str. L20]ACE62207.1 putative transcriptional regulator [Actinobacillus pleuropneumoniae serovar 7 str. AP76]ASU15338.1 Antitoxin HigA1 [Actinobacillus pleuropneumoniae]AWG95920.1 transcriptional regulator [Actinobacillus pleuropneumoniae serovar 1 str. 4074]AXA21991.1 helix-turn-helix domain-containing protein [Actinobacillus pleuropneu